MAELMTRIIIRNDSKTNWKANETTVLFKGEMGIEFDPAPVNTQTDVPKIKVKIGDGITAWKDLPYFGGEDAHVYELTVAKGTDQTKAISDATTKTDGILYNKTITTHDVLIVKEAIIAQSIIDAAKAETPARNIEQQYQHTAYRWNGTAWAAFDGNYSANNVYFENDFTFTKAIGTVSTIPSSGSTTKAAAGKNLTEFFASLFAEEAWGTIKDNPSATLTVGVSESGSNSGEVGTTFNPPYATLALDAEGDYTFDAKDADGTEYSTVKLSFNTAKVWYKAPGESAYRDTAIIDIASDTTSKSSASYSDTYTVSDLTGDALEFTETAKVFSFKAEAKSDADTCRALSNLGKFEKKNDDGTYTSEGITYNTANVYIPAKTLLDGANTSSVKTVSYTGYRKMFMGAVNSHPNSNIDSAFIRTSLTTISKKAATGDNDFKAVNGQCGFYVAIPTSFTTKAPTFKTEFNKEYIDFTGVEVYMGKDSTTGLDVWEDISTATTYGTVNVEGANNYNAAPYRVYRYIPSTATGKFTASETKYRVKVSN